MTRVGSMSCVLSPVRSKRETFRALNFSTPRDAEFPYLPRVLIEIVHVYLYSDAVTCDIFELLVLAFENL